MYALVLGLRRQRCEERYELDERSRLSACWPEVEADVVITGREVKAYPKLVSKMYR